MVVMLLYDLITTSMKRSIVEDSSSRGWDIMGGKVRLDNIVMIAETHGRREIRGIQTTHPTRGRREEKAIKRNKHSIRIICLNTRTNRRINIGLSHPWTATAHQTIRGMNQRRRVIIQQQQTPRTATPKLAYPTPTHHGTTTPKLWIPRF